MLLWGFLCVSSPFLHFFPVFLPPFSLTAKAIISYLRRRRLRKITEETKALGVFSVRRIDPLCGPGAEHELEKTKG